MTFLKLNIALFSISEVRVEINSSLSLASHRSQSFIEKGVYIGDKEFGGRDVTSFEHHQACGFSQQLEERFSLCFEWSVFVITAMNHKLPGANMWSKVDRIGIGQCHPIVRHYTGSLQHDSRITIFNGG
jgi:hypothetical protein